MSEKLELPSSPLSWAERAVIGLCIIVLWTWLQNMYEAQNADRAVTQETVKQLAVTQAKLEQVSALLDRMQDAQEQINRILATRVKEGG